MYKELKKIYNRNDIPNFLQKFYPNGIGIELGVATGQYLTEIADGWTTGKLYGVDCWEMQDPNIYKDIANNPALNHLQEFVKQRIQKYNDRVRVYKLYTTQAALQFPDEYFDFIYIDANHSYEATLADIKSFYPKAKPGCLFGGHDYSDHESWGVKEAVNDFFKNKVEIVTFPCSSWFVFK